LASDRKLNIYNEDNVTINVVEESDNQLTIINESPTVEVITIYEQGPQGPRGEKGEGANLPTEIISGSGANNLLALFVSGGYITGSKNLSFDGSNLNISGSVYISTFSGSAVSLAGISQDNNLTNITIGSGLNLLNNTLNAVGSLTGTGSITQLAFWTASKAISGSQNLVYDYTNNRLGINNSNPQYALDVSGTVHLSGSLINASHIDFSTSSYSTNAPARITWNPDFGTLDLGVVGGNVNLSWGLEVAAYVVNGESTTLLDGEVVYMSGSRGDKPKVYRASSLTELTSTKTFGVVTEHILSDQLGYVTTQGVVNGLNLGSFNPGDAVWLGTTPGTFTVTKPQAPTHSVFVGIVQRANAGAGQLYVRVQNGYEIDELHNVRITNPQNGQLLAYNQAQQIWVNGNTLSGSYFVSGSIQATSFTGSLLGTASYADIIRSGGVLGSGGANQVAFWSDTGSLTGNSLMLVESANNRFRIGNIYYGTSGITTTQGGSAASIFMSSANRNINMDGNVGIGTSPAATLHVSGSSGSGLFEIDSNSSQNILFVSGSGNVGINTNNPAYKLDVIGNGRFRGSGTTSATTTFRAENSAGTAGFFVRDDGYFFNGDSTFQVRPYAVGGTTAIINNTGHNNAQGLQVTSAVGIVAASSLGVSTNNVYGASIYAQGGSSGGNVSLGLLSNRALISAGTGLSMHNSAMLQVESTTLGFLLPRMTSTQRNAIVSSSRGLMVYVTTPADEGVYYYNSGSSYQGWTRLLNSSGSQTLTGSLDILGTLNTSVYSGSSAYISGDVYVGGKVTAQEFFTQYVSSSIIYQSGSTKFGDSLDDIHQRTGSMSVTGSVNIAGMLTAHSYSGSSMMLSGNMYSTEYIISGSNSRITGSSKISNWYDSGDSFYVGSQATVSEGVFFNDTGTKMYIVDSTADRIYAYDLSTPWTLSSAVYNNEFSPLLSTYEGTPTDLYIKPDGTKLWIIGNTSDRVVEYNLPTPWLVSSMTFVKFISIVNEDSAATGLYFSLDGTKMYIVGTTNDRIYQYNLSAAWDIATAVVGNNLSVTNICSAPQSIDFSIDGSYLYLIGSNSDIIVEYYLSVPWELSSAVYSGQSVTITGLESFPRGVFFADDSKKVFYVGSTGDIVKSLNADNQLRFQTSASSFSGTVVFEKGLDVPLNQYASFFGPVYANQTIYVNGASTFIGAMVSTGITNNSSITSTNDTNLSTAAGRSAYIANTAASNTQNVEILNNSTWGGTKNLRVLSGASGSINNFYIGGTSGGQVNIYSYADFFEHSGYLTIGSNLKVAGQMPRIDSVYNIVTGSTIFYDTFTEASNTLLNAHVPDLGSSWNLTFSNSATATVTVRGGLGQMGPTISVGDRGSYYLTNTTSSFNDYQITTTIQAFDSADDVVWVLFRWQDDNNYYAIRWSSTIGQVLKKVAGVWTSLGNAIALSTGTNTTLMVRVFGSNIIIFQNGRWSGTFVDADITSGGYFGIGFGNIGYISGDDVDSTWQINEFKVEEIDYNIAVNTFESFYNKHYFESGNVGIGSINPIAKLHVSGSSGSGLFEIDSNSSQNIIYVSGSGNVGIGTNTPAYRLDVIGNGRFRGQGTTSATYGLQVHNSTGTNNALTVRDDGRVGIGTSSPAQTLHVQGSVRGTVDVEAGNSFYFYGHNLLMWPTTAIGDSGNAYTFADGPGTTYKQIKVSSIRVSAGSSATLAASFNSSGQAFISGSLGIGTNNPAYTLDVSGTGRFTNGIIVSGSTTTIGNLIVTGSVTSTNGFTGSYKGDISPQSTINGNPVIDMYTAIAFSVAL
jgi:hypothetical protein